MTLIIPGPLFVVAQFIAAATVSIPVGILAKRLYRFIRSELQQAKTRRQLERDLTELFQVEELEEVTE